MKRWMIGATVVAAALAVHIYHVVPTQANAVQLPLRIVEGPLTVITTTGGATLTGAEIRQVAGRTFIVGIEIKDRRDMIKPHFIDSKVWIPLDSVVQFVE